MSGQRRERLLLLLVLIPSAALLILWALSADQETRAADQPPPTLPPAPIHASAATEIRPSAPAMAAHREDPPDAGVTEKPLTPTLPSAAPLIYREQPFAADLAPAMTAVLPEIRSCVTDQQARIEGPLTLTFRVTPLRDGGLRGYTLVKSTWQDPYLSSCLEDVFDELHFVPSGAERDEPREVTLEFQR